MKHIILMLFLFLIVSFPACSGGNGNPLIPPADENGGNATLQQDSTPVEASDVLYNRASGGIDGYKAYGIYHVRIDPSTLSVEILPARNAEAIGHTFDADLTQFLIKAPCFNCLQLAGIKYLGNNEVQVGFSVRHPFPTLTSRPDLHGFDVRGIVIAKGNYNFPHILVALGQTSFAPARANISLVKNADGYTHHFDELAADTNYFNPPRSYDSNINPFKRYFVNGSAGAFNPMSPSGHNVMPTGAAWETQNFIFNIPQGSEAIDFAYIVDCAYGQSATFQNRTNPYYFLPEFNRKEAWKVDAEVVTNDLQSGSTSSSAQIKVTVCDWQAGFAVDPNFPDTGNLDGIKAESDVANVELEITSVCNVVQVSTPASGNGSFANPYIFNFNVTNSLAADAGTYYGLVAVRDDLHGQQGPFAIPASPATFAGPEIYDYTAYQMFSIRVKGSPPVVNSISPPSIVYDNSLITLNSNITEPDGDQVTYLWEQTAPASPTGTFVNPAVRNAQWISPDLYDIPEEGMLFTLKLTVSDIDGSNFKEISFYVKEINHAPLCLGINMIPYDGVISPAEDVSFTVLASDPDNDPLSFEWDFDYDGMTFDVDSADQNTVNNFDSAGIFRVASRITELRANALSTICEKYVIVQGCYDEDIKIDESASADPDYFSPDVSFSGGVYHSVWLSNTNYSILYGNNAEDHDAFGNYATIGFKPTTGNNHNPKVIASLNTVIVIWTEYDTSVNPFEWRLKVRRSTNGGRVWLDPQTIVIKESPDTLDDLAICAGMFPSQFFIFYEAKESANINNIVIASSDDGATWVNPSGGDQIRDVFGVGDFVEDLNIGISTNNVLYTFWLDGQVTPARFLLDWSQDGGASWHTDIVAATTSDTFIDGAMSLDKNGAAYLTTLTDNSNYTIKKVTFTTSPSLSQMISIGASGISSIDIWTSPDGQYILVPLTQTGGVAIFLSNNAGISWGTMPGYFSHSTGSVYDVVVDGYMSQAPDRDEILLTWVDNRGGAGQQAHIYGNFAYFAQ